MDANNGAKKHGKATPLAKQAGSTSSQLGGAFVPGPGAAQSARPAASLSAPASESSRDVIDSSHVHEQDDDAGESGGWGEKRIFTTGEAAQICKVSQQTIIRCFDSGRLGGFRVPGSKFRRIPRSELIKFMKANDIPLDALDQGSRRVLVVDDDPQIVEMMRDILTRQGRYEVKTCANGYDAGLLTESFRPHVILLDYLLPDINGNVVCQRLREREDLATTRVLFISGVVSADELGRLKDSGADGFLHKPFDVDVLLSKIEELLSTERA